MSKLFQVIFTIITLFVSMSQGAVNYSNVKLINKFSMWMNKFNIETRNEDHLAHIFDNWISNNKYIEEMNGKNLSYTLGHNTFSGMDSEEFGQYMGFIQNKDIFSKGLRGSINIPLIEQVEELGDLPTSVDWRTKGVVSPIRNQAQCGSCWAFSTVATLESLVAIHSGNLYDLSEQELVSCANFKNGYTSLGCNGGTYENAFTFVKNEAGLSSESCYPYTSGNGDSGTCKKTCSHVAGTKVSSYTAVTSYSDSAMMTALTIEPVNVAIEADSRSFQLYKSGLYSDLEGCGHTLDHAVVLVGYGSDNGQDYYILRNSWDITWGENGYMKLSRGSQNGKYGMCGVLSEPIYPNL
jgi:C1A family cysteine protease